MKTKLSAVVAALVISAPLLGAPATLTVSQAIEAMSGTRANFVQRFTPRGFKNAQVESGTVIFGASPKMRWAYAKPEAKTFVFDGATSWFYVPSDRQVSVNKLSEKDRQGLPFLLLSDAQAVAKNYVVKESRRGDVVTTNLTSRDPASMIRQITVTTSARARTVSKLEYSDRQGNKTEFTFSGYQKVPSSPEQFTFVAPAGVQVVRN